MQAQNLPRQFDEQIKPALGLSIGLHVLLIAAFTLKVLFFPSDDLDLDNAIHVDMVDLPDKTQPPPIPVTAEPPPQPAPTAEAAPEPVVNPEPAPPPPEPAPNAPPRPPPAEPEKVNLEKAKSDQASALKRLEAMEKLQKMMQKEKPPPPTVVKGNQVTQGNQLTGLSRAEHRNYIALVTNLVKSRWNLPGWLANASLSAHVRVFVDAQGRVLKREISQSSQNQAYDEFVTGAIDSSSPLPAPPGDLVDILAHEGMELEFIPSR